MDKKLHEWIFSKKSFWFLGLVYSLWSGMETLKSGMIWDFLATSVAAFGIVFVVYMLVYIVLYLTDSSQSQKRAIEKLTKELQETNKKLNKK